MTFGCVLETQTIILRLHILKNWHEVTSCSKPIKLRCLVIEPARLQIDPVTLDTCVVLQWYLICMFFSLINEAKMRLMHRSFSRLWFIQTGLLGRFWSPVWQQCCIILNTILFKMIYHTDIMLSDYRIPVCDQSEQEVFSFLWGDTVRPLTVKLISNPVFFCTELFCTVLLQYCILASSPVQSPVPLSPSLLLSSS